MRAVLHLHVELLIEILWDLSGDLDLVTAGVKACDPAHTAATAAGRRPISFSTDSVRGNRPNSRDSYSTHELDFAFNLPVSIG